MGTAQSEQFRYSFEGDLDGLQRQHKQIVGMFNKLVNDINQISKGLTIGGGSIDTSAQKGAVQGLYDTIHNLETKKVDDKKKAAKEIVDIDKETAKQQEKIARESARKQSEIERGYAAARQRANLTIGSQKANVSSAVSKANALGIPGTDYTTRGNEAIKQLEDYRRKLRKASEEAVTLGTPDAKDNLLRLEKEVKDFTKRSTKAITDDAKARLGMIKQAGEAEVASRKKTEADKLKALNASAKEQSRIQKQLASEQEANARRINAAYAKIGRAETDIKNIFANAKERKPTVNWDPQETAALTRLQSLQNNLVQAQTQFNSAKTPENAKQVAGVTKEINNLVSGTRHATNETLKATGAMGSAWGRLQSVLSRIAMWWGTAFALWKTGDLIRQVYNISGAFEYLVKELTAIGDEGEKAYRRLAMAGYDAAEQTGRRFEEAAVAMREFVRQGFSVADINDLVKTTLIGLNITEMGATQLIKSLTAEMRAFNIPARDSISIIDKLMGVSKEYAIDANELATGIRKFAGVSQQANITLDQQMGIMTAVMERTKQAPEAIGTGWRTILTRLQRNAVDAVENIAKVEVYTDKSRQTYRSMWDILNDLAQAWPKMTAAAKEEVAFQAAGQRQIEFFIAAMEGWDTAIQATVESMASAGMAYKTNAMLVDTLQKSVAALRTEWEKLLASQNGVSNYFRTLVDGIRSLLNISAQIPESVGAIAGAVAMIGGFGVAISGIGGGLGLMGGLAAGFAGLGATISYVMGKMDSGNIRKISERYKELIATQYQTRKATSDLAQEFVSLYKKSDETKNKQDSLKLIWTKLNELNPALIQGARNLGDVYTILAGKVEELSKAEQEAYEKRQQMIKSEKEVELSGLMRDLSTQRKKMPIEFQSMSDEQLIAELPKAYTNLNDSIISINDKIREQARLQETINNLKGEGISINQRDYDTLSKVRDALQENLKTAVDDNRVKRAAKALSLDRKDIFGLPTMTPYNAAQYGDVLYPARGLLALQTVEKTMERIKSLKEGEVLTDRERSQLATSLVTAENVLYAIYEKSNGKLVANQEEQAKMFQETFDTINAIKNAREAIKDINGVGKIKGFGEGEPPDLGFEPDKVNKYRTEVDKLIQRLDQEGELLARQKYLNEGIAISKENQGLVDRIIFDYTQKGLQAELQRTENAEKREAIEESIKEFVVGGNREVALRVSLLQGMQAVQESIGSLEQRNNDKLMKGLDKQISTLEKYYQIQNDYAQAIKDRAVSAQADTLKAENKPVEAAQLLLNYAIERNKEAEIKFRESLKDGIKLDSELIDNWQKNATRIDMLSVNISDYKRLMESTSIDKLLSSPKMGKALVEAMSAMERYNKIVKDTSGNVTQGMVDELAVVMGTASTALGQILAEGGTILDEQSRMVVKNLLDNLNKAYEKMGGDPSKLKDMQVALTEYGKTTQDLVTTQGQYNTALAESAQKLRDLAKEQEALERARRVESVKADRGETAGLEENLRQLVDEKKQIDDLIQSLQTPAIGMPAGTNAQVIDLQIKSKEKELEVIKASNALDAQRLGINKDINKELTDIGFKEREQAIEKGTLRNGEIWQLEEILKLRKAEVDVYEAGLRRKYFGMGLPQIFQRYPETKQEDMKLRGNVDAAAFDVELANIRQATTDKEKYFQNNIDFRRKEAEEQLVGMEYQVGEIDLLEARLKLEEDLRDKYLDKYNAESGTVQQIDTENLLLEQQNRVNQANLALKQAQISAEQELLNLVIQTSAAQISSMIGGNFSAGGLIQGLMPILIGASGVATGGTAAALMTAGGTIMSAIADKFGEKTDKLADSLDQNRLSINRLDQTMKDVTEKMVGVPSGFVLPPAYTRSGGIPFMANGGDIVTSGLVYAHAGEKVVRQAGGNYTAIININGANASVNEIANKVDAVLSERWGVEKRLGYSRFKY